VGRGIGSLNGGIVQLKGGGIGSLKGGGILRKEKREKRKLGDCYL
jgi:hypothetical protein